MTNDEVRPAAGGPVHSRYCGECGTRIDQLCPKCYTAAQPEPPTSLRKAVKCAAGDIWDKAFGDRGRKYLLECTIADIIFTAVRPLLEAREKLLREALEHRIDDDWLKRVRTLIGGEDE